VIPLAPPLSSVIIRQNNNFVGGVPKYLNFGTTNGGNAQFSVETWIIQYLYVGGGSAIVALGYGNGGEQFVLDDRRFWRRSAFLCPQRRRHRQCRHQFVRPAKRRSLHHVVGTCDETAGHVYL